MTKITYSDSGVDVELGDQASDILYKAAKATWNNRKDKVGEVICPFDDFSGLRAIDVSSLPQNTLMGLGFDGVGTKMELAERISKHDTIAYDLFAMVCDDAVVRGGEPVVVGSVLDINTLGNKENSYIELIEQLAKGYIGAASDANVAVINGELAELGNRVNGYGKFNYNWSAGLIWLANKDRIFTGKEIQAGDYIVALHEQGIRSNGLSLVRNILDQIHGSNWHEFDLDGRNLAEIALEPSKIYSKAVVEMFGGVADEPKVQLHGVAHITGGGIPSKLGRILKSTNFGATLDDVFDPPLIIKYCQEMGNVSDREAYSTWNMGQGMLLITPEPEKVIDIAHSNDHMAKKVGSVTSQAGLKITNKGYFNSTEPILEF